MLALPQSERGSEGLTDAALDGILAGDLQRGSDALGGQLDLARRPPPTPRKSSHGPSMADLVACSSSRLFNQTSGSAKANQFASHSPEGGNRRCLESC